MANIKSEDLRLSITVNGDAARKNIAEVERKIKDAEIALKSFKAEAKKKSTTKARSDELKKSITATSASIEQMKNQLTGLKNNLNVNSMTMKELDQRLRQLKSQFKTAIPGTENWVKLNSQLSEAKKRMDELSSGVSATEAAMSSIGSASVTLNAVAQIYDRFSGQIEQAIEAYLAFDEAQVDAMKTTNLTRAEIDSLSESLRKIDTKTPINELLNLVRAGGKLGISGEDDLLGFARAADMINVALSEDLGGNAEAAITAIGKMTDIFSLQSEYGVEESMLKVGSAINSLGMASTANEGYIVDFAQRLAGIAPNADITIDKVLGLAATLDKYGQSSETSATALGQVIVAMFSKTQTFADIAGKSLQEFSVILNNDVNAALLAVLEGMGADQGGLASVAAAMDAMNLNGQRATTVMGTLAKNVDELRNQQSLANEAFTEGNSIQAEFEAKNTSATASVQKMRNAITEATVQLGERLMPLLNSLMSATQSGLNLLIPIVSAVVKYRAAVVALTVAITAYNVVAKLRNFYSKEHRAALIAETSALNGAKVSTILMSAATNTLALNFKAAGVAIKALWTTLKANPIGLVLGAIAAIASGIAALTKNAREARKAQREFNDALAETRDEIAREKSEAETLFNAAMKTAAGTEARKNAIARLNSEYGDYLPNLLSETSSNADLAIALQSVNTQLEDRIRLQGRTAALSAADESLQTATKSMRDVIARSAKRHRGEDLSSAEMSVLLDEIVQYREMAKSNDANLLRRADARFRYFINNFTGQNMPEKSYEKFTQDFRQAILNYINQIGEIDSLYGTGGSSSGGSLGGGTGTTVTSPTTGGGGGTTASGSGSKWSLSGDVGYQEALLKLKQRLRDEDIKSEEEYQSEVLKLEILTLRDRINSGKAQGEELLSLKSQLADREIRLETQTKESEARARKEAAQAEKQELEDRMRLQEEAYNLRKSQEEERYAKGENDEKQHNENMLKIEEDYLRARIALLQTVLGTEEGERLTLDGGENDKLTSALQTARTALAKLMGSGEKSEGKGKDRQGSLFGVRQDEWEQFFDNIQTGKVGIEEIGTATKALGGAFNEIFSIWNQALELQSAKEDNAFKEYQKQNDEKAEMLEKRLDAGLMTESQYNAEIRAMEEEEEAYKEELELKQAKRQKAQKLAQAIINTALGVSKTLAEWGIPAGIAPAAIMAAMGAAQIAMIAATPVSSGYAEGGLVTTKREQDGRSYQARLSPQKRGFVSSPTILVGEEGGEYVIPAEGLANPSLRPFIATLETARRNGTLRNISLDAVGPSIVAKGRAAGGYSSAPSVSAAPARQAATAADSRLAEAIEALTSRLKDPISAEVSMLGKNGIVRQTERYNNYVKRGRIGK